MERLAGIEPIVSLLYDGVMNPGDWYDGLDAINEALGGIGFHYLVMNAQSFAVLDSVSSTELPEGKVREYEAHYAKDDPRAARVFALSVGQVVADSDHFDARAVSRTPIFADWLMPLGIRDTLSVKLRTDEAQREFLAFFRSPDQCLFEPQEKIVFERLLPHLHRASELRARMGQLEKHAALGLSALDKLPQGILIVDDKGRIQHLNRAAQACLAAATVPCRAVHEHLVFAASEADARFRHLVTAACRQRSPASAGAFRLACGADQWLGVSVLPLKASHPLASFRQIHLAMVVLADPNASASPSAALLGELLGLTPTEARLALALAAGKTIHDFANAESCSWHTARAHLKNLLRKTGCHRQVDLVRLIQTLAFTAA
ncbi:helix-turn-helix transcriptional regulator [Polaromonas jejuensis]|uniref:Helix-turn-helix transcriptional regulator n=1 Tax=Polaromonas jejuensis TaxID=457502 RepID=A0ABW0Q4U5_9BURK|nr:PAS domain-containing protein [Polaromonas jejuensis]